MFYFILKCVIRFPDGNILSMSTNTAKWPFLLFLEVLQQLFSSKSIFFYRKHKSNLQTSSILDSPKGKRYRTHVLFRN